MLIYTGDDFRELAKIVDHTLQVTNVVETIVWDDYATLVLNTPAVEVVVLNVRNNLELEVMILHSSRLRHKRLDLTILEYGVEGHGDHEDYRNLAFRIAHCVIHLNTLLKERGGEFTEVGEELEQLFMCDQR